LAFGGALGNNLATIDLEQSHRQMSARVIEDAGHAEFLSN